MSAMFLNRTSAAPGFWALRNRIGADLFAGVTFLSGGAPAETLFIDRSVSDCDTLLRGLRPEIEANFLDGPAHCADARQPLAATGVAEYAELRLSPDPVTASSSPFQSYGAYSALTAGTAHYISLNFGEETDFTENCFAAAGGGAMQIAINIKYKDRDASSVVEPVLGRVCKILEGSVQ
ncbi:hypothetical protein QM467_06710 [Rhodoblastus sp. 17X3]|uniref:hypothetical protein n=1 Tax=Rhodoblastus sp. 17X3 TaxID=3047026 RepID=UPI0024B7B8F5|nr:hypothetical protein [Rhodoblastus sp. 17X3]MDI9847743.1 hypothetical protein [Rhodoblastus sp. 17X3]